VLMVASGVAQPLVTAALHRAPFTTVTVPAPSATYTVSVLWSRAAASGEGPAAARATTRHPDTVVVLHVAALIMSMTCPGVVQELVVHWIGT